MVLDVFEKLIGRYESKFISPEHTNDQAHEHPFIPFHPHASFQKGPSNYPYYQFFFFMFNTLNQKIQSTSEPARTAQ